VDSFRSSLETMTQAFEARVAAVSARDLASRTAELTAYRDRVVRRMHARYRHLHRDFRVSTDDALTAFQTSLDELLARLVAQLPPPSDPPSCHGWAGGGTVPSPLSPLPRAGGGRPAGRAVQ
jgi:hypothetical protein